MRQSHDVVSAAAVAAAAAVVAAAAAAAAADVAQVCTSPQSDTKTRCLVEIIVTYWQIPMCNNFFKNKFQHQHCEDGMDERT